MKRRSLSAWQFNLIYLAILGAFVYSWPYTVYGKMGKQMAENTSRERFVVTTVGRFAKQRDLNLRPHFRVGEVPASAGAFSGQAVIVVSPAMLDPAKFSDAEVEFILGHELGHIERYDAYRFWTSWRRDFAEHRESAADKIGVSLAGCGAMANTVRRHLEEFMEGYTDPNDPHPHPDTRLALACPGWPGAGRK